MLENTGNHQGDHSGINFRILADFLLVLLHSENVQKTWPLTLRSNSSEIIIRHTCGINLSFYIALFSTFSHLQTFTLFQALTNFETVALNKAKLSLTKSIMHHFPVSYLTTAASGSSQSAHSRQPGEEETSRGLLAFGERHGYLFICITRHCNQ